MLGVEHCLDLTFCLFDCVVSPSQVLVLQLVAFCDFVAAIWLFYFLIYWHCQMVIVGLPVVGLLITNMCSMCVVSVMGRKKRTEGGPSGGESSEPQRPAERSAPPQQQAAGPGGTGSQGGGRAWGPQGGRGGYGGGRGRGMPQQQYGIPQQQYGAPADYQGRGRGGSSQQGGRGGYGGGRSGGVGGGGRGIGPSYGGSSRPPVPELHQATSVQSYQTGVSPQPTSSEASSSLPPEPVDLEPSVGQMVIAEATPTPPPQSKSSMRFPLRPGKGSYGIKCIVKANHFFAELPNKDLHQYDVSSLFSDCRWKILIPLF